ncbi:FAD-dependent oxidoreductase [Rhodococcus hoagii]|nr:FAD-dependent oxidoreductase [Prescottella equi]
MSARVPVTPIDAAEITAYDHETDVLVIGYGCAGASAALEADAAGADVVLLERQSGGGGSSALSGGEMYLGGGTPIQEACGFTDTAEEMEKFLLAALGPDADQAKVGLYSRESVAHYQWLVDHGVPFKPSLWDSPTWVPPTDDGLMWMGENAYPFYEIAEPAPRGHRVTSDGFGGKVLMAVLSEAVTKTDIAVHTDTTALRLIMEDGRVVGVVARHFNETVTYRARRGVVITTGGFADNKEMLAQHAPQLVGLGVNSDGGDDGRGIVMAQAVGAAVKHMSAGQVGISLVPGMMVRGMIVNSVGQRFINEDVYPGLVGQAALFKHNLKVWVILDEQAYEEVPVDERWGVQPHFVAEALEELEREIGMPEGALQNTVGEYNRFAEHGEDPYFHKSARWLRPLQSPFAAIDVQRGMAPPEYGDGGTGGGGAEVFTIGGLRTTVDGRVLDLDDDAIPGLFAAGRATSGLHSWGYISGTSLGDGTFFGRRAGVAASRE